MIEYMILKYGLNYMPASLNIIAKRVGISESDKALNALKDELEKLVLKKKVFKSGNRYAIDMEGAKFLSSLPPPAGTHYPTPKNFGKQFKQLMVNR